MSKENIDKWLDRIERFINLIRPRFHNAITRTVVGFGLALAVESQINFFEAIGVAVYETFFGPSEFLRYLFSTSPNAWTGVIFVIFGLIYNAIVTVGLELVEKYKKAIPREPELKLSIVNVDKEEFDESYTMRGIICFHNINDIPEYTQDRDSLPFELGYAYRVFVSSTGRSRPEINRNLYRERAEFLKVWGGAEIFYLKIENIGSVIARNARVEVTIPKLPRMSAKNENKLHPKLPSLHHEPMSRMPFGVDADVPFYDIKHSNSPDAYFFEWSIERIQPKEIKTSVTEIFFRTESECEMHIKIFCDEISNPIISTFKVYPAASRREISLSLIMSDEKEFLTAIDEFVMDGYIGRYHTKLFKEYQSEQDVLLP